MNPDTERGVSDGGTASTDISSRPRPRSGHARAIENGVDQRSPTPVIAPIQARPGRPRPPIRAPVQRDVSAESKTGARHAMRRTHRHPRLMRFPLPSIANLDEAR
ncbi:hypothetical protein L1787_06085 [Acuticoccus sp. M5D2P5]|uniref:hypothetical protein n=1 Tax=Acuticoccus kalidii TaxID=2910977 RepID=UPI001F344044|nr:hypothetical protein [Acuticoccus kalidii]MCF3932982.1 hypothetical protein [Acuticoccus kalidii]